MGIKNWIEMNRKDVNKCNIQELEWKIKDSTKISNIVIFAALILFTINMYLYITANSTIITYWGIIILFFMLYLGFFVEIMKLRVLITIKQQHPQESDKIDSTPVSVKDKAKVDTGETVIGS